MAPLYHSEDQFPTILSLQENTQPAEFVLKTEVCTIGRSSTCDIVIIQNGRKTVSRLHARIERAGPRYLLYDNHSANGTFANESRLDRPHLLEHDDVIGLGAPTPILRFHDPDPTDLTNHRLSFDSSAMLFFLDRQPLALSPNEFRLLYHLYQYPRVVCSRDSCAQAIWSRAYDPGSDDDNLDRIVSNIRRKLRRSTPAATELIQTRRGLGYQYTPE